MLKCALRVVSCGLVATLFAPSVSAEPPVVDADTSGRMSLTSTTHETTVNNPGPPEGPTNATESDSQAGAEGSTSAANVVEPYSEEWLAQRGITQDNPDFHRLYYQGTSAGTTPLTPEQSQAFQAALDNSTLPPACLDDAVSPVYFADFCVPAFTGAPGTTAAPRPSRGQVQTLVKTVIAKMQVPKPTIQVGPDPSVNEWKMAVVGYPLWLWTSEAPTQSTTTTEAGITLTLNATRTAVTFDMGDGSTPLTCATATPYRKPASMDHPEPSPDCGYVYQRPSLPSSSYTVTASAQWSVAWTGAGYSGTLPLQLTTQRPLPVGELQSVRVG